MIVIMDGETMKPNQKIDGFCIGAGTLCFGLFLLCLEIDTPFQALILIGASAWLFGAAFMGD